jgi:endoglucanase
MIYIDDMGSMGFVQVGDGDSDHNCWQRPEDMTTSREAYAVTKENPGSDLAAETAAAMAAASIAFRKIDPVYSSELLRHARELFRFADTYRGKYDSSIPLAKKYYQSQSGYNDELLWGAIWLHEATNEEAYLQYVASNAEQMGGTVWTMNQFSWENKYVGVQLKATKLLLDGKTGSYAPIFEQYQAKAEYFLCAALQKNNGPQMQLTPGGMYWIFRWNNMQYVTSAAFLLTVAHDYYSAVEKQLSHCSAPVENWELLAAGKAQVDYLLGKNIRGQSYLVGFGPNYPQRVHHRGASIVSLKQNPQFVSCRGGYEDWYIMKDRNPNLLVGALVGGPDQNDNFVDERDAYEMTEPTTYNTAPLVGVLARLQGVEEGTLHKPGVQFLSSYCCWIFPLLFSNFTYWFLWRTFNIAISN